MKEYENYVMHTYKRWPVKIVKGKGSTVEDDKGKKYLDLFPGWGVSALGHCHPRVVKAIITQSPRLLHLPNNYYNEWQGELAEKLVKLSLSRGKAFFCNSGAEANEAAIKLARRYGNAQSPRRFEIVTMENAFHGRTLATITATGQKKYQEGFQPLVRGFKQVKFNDLRAIKKAITSRTCAVLIEPIQGEGGVWVAHREYLKGLRQLCSQKKVLLILDEVQTGMGRTGKMFAYQWSGIKPDIITLAKALAGGLPAGAMIARDEVAKYFTPGAHASTFGGSPVVCRAALAVLEAIEKENLLENAKRMGEYLKKRLQCLQSKYEFIKEIRGRGLMLGMELTIPGDKIVEQCLKKGLLINCTHERILRFLPPMEITRKEIDKAIRILDAVLTTN